MYVDQNGHWIIKDFLQWKVKTIDIPILEYTEDTLSQFNGTYATGYNINGTLGFWDLSYQFGIAIDFKGNIILQYTPGGGITTDDPSLSFVRYRSTSNTPSVKELEGLGVSLGGGASFKHVVLGEEVNIYVDQKNDKAYWGITNYGGVTTSSVGLEGHINWGYTDNLEITEFNIYKLLDCYYHKILEW